MITTDKSTTFLIEDRLGKKQALTPEGFLLCEQVPIARVGLQLYAAEEIEDITPGGDGVIRVERRPDDVFRPETIASFEGKTITDDHPDDMINPDNWKEYAVGHVQNVHRGEGADSDFLFADFLITDAAAINAVREGKREVSCGYDADYEELAPGRGRQYNIIGNHVALVEKGRCGPSCAIHDKEHPMAATAKKSKVRDAIKALQKKMGFSDDDLTQAMTEPTEPGEDDAPEAAEGSTPHVEIHNHIHHPGDMPADDAAEGGGEGAPPNGEEMPGWAKTLHDGYDKRFSDIEGAVGSMGQMLKKWAGEEAEEHDPEAGEEDSQIEGIEPPGPGTGDEDPDEKEEKKTKDKKGTKDSAGLSTLFKTVTARAEILCPGIKLPTFDAAMGSKKTLDTLCAFRRSALHKAYAMDDGKEAIDEVLDGVALNTKTMTCDAVTQLFNAAHSLAKAKNNIYSTGVIIESRRTDDNKSAPQTPADLNKINRERHGMAKH